MGACNFKHHNSVDVGLDDSAEEDQDEVLFAYERAGKYKDLVNAWIESRIPCDNEFINRWSVISVDIEPGYYSGWQMWQEIGDWEDVIDTLISETEWRAGWWKDYRTRFNCSSIFECLAGVNSPKALREEFSKLEYTTNAILANLALEEGWGNVVGGWCGGVRFDSMQEQAADWKSEADPHLWADWEKYRKSHGRYYGL